MSLPTPLIYLPLTYAPTDSIITQTNLTSTNYDSNNGIIFNDIQARGNGGGTNKSLSVPRPDGIPVSLNITVCFNLYIGNYFPGNALRVFTQGNPDDTIVKESIKIEILSDKKLVLTLSTKGSVAGGQSLGNGNSLTTTTPLNPNTWYFVAYNIYGSSCNPTTNCNAYQIKLFVNNKTANIPTRSTNQQDNLGYNYGYQVNGGGPVIANVNYNKFQIGDRFYTTPTNAGFGLNGCIRDFMIFGDNIAASTYNSIVGTNLINMSNTNLPTPPTTFGPLLATSNNATTFNPIYQTPSSAVPFSYISALQTLINYFPPPNISLPLTTAPVSPTATVNSGTTITYDATKGAIFPNKASPELGGTTTNNSINIPVTFTNKLTVSFPIYLNYNNTNSLRILTLGNVSGSNTSEALYINSNYIKATGDQTIATANCSTNARKYAIATTVNNTATNQNTIINQNAPATISSLFTISTVNGYNKTGQLQNNNTANASTTFVNTGLSQFPYNNVVTITGDTSNIFSNPNNYIGKYITGPFINGYSTIVSITSLGTVATSSSQQTLFSFKISDTFTGYPITLSGGNIYQYNIGTLAPSASSVDTAVVSTPSGSITNKYKGLQFTVDECAWNLVSLVLDGSNITMYINNNVCTSVTIPSGFTYNTIRLGDAFSNSNRCFVGNLKNFMIYNNIFTVDNIKFLYNKHILNTPSANVALHFNQNNIPLLENNVPLLENDVETFVNMHPSNTFVKYTRLFSIVGILFYAVLLLGNMNYEKIIPNKNVSFGLNVLLVTSILIALTN